MLWDVRSSDEELMTTTALPSRLRVLGPDPRVARRRAMSVERSASSSVSLPLLDALPPLERERLFASARQKAFPRGAVIASRGRGRERVAIVLSGIAARHHVTRDGRQLILDVHGPGDVLGLPELFARARPDTSVTALDRVAALTIDRGAVERAMRTSPAVAGEFLRRLALGFTRVEDCRIELETCDVLTRISRRIVMLADRWGVSTPQGVEVDLLLTQEGLAAWAGASREAAVEALATLRDNGIVQTARRKIVILNPPGLRTCAGWPRTAAVVGQAPGPGAGVA